MSRKNIFTSLLVCGLLAIGLIAFAMNKDSVGDDLFVTYTVDPKSDDIAFYWRDDNGQIIGSIENLKSHVEHNNSELVFATNGGMYDANRYPQGLFIERSIVLGSLDTSVLGKGNFYLYPNGVFYITIENKAVICKTEDFVDNGKIKYATQSGPMLLIDGEIHPAFIENSTNLHIRNGVGILPNKKVVFAMSKKKINFHDFATYFKSLGCENALYFDGYVSRTYLPEKNWIQTDGDFGVIIGVTRSLHSLE